jgi:hypothetical protein
MHNRLKAARINAGFKTASAAIERFHWKDPAYRAHERGQNPFKAKDAEAYGLAYGVSPAWLLTGEGEMLSYQINSHSLIENLIDPNQFYNTTKLSKVIPLVGIIAIGHWEKKSSSESIVDEKLYGAPPADPRFQAKYQFDLLVQGDSFNKFANSGDIVRCIDHNKSGLTIEENDLVIVERTRHSLRELSARRYMRLRGYYILQTESNEKSFQEPLIYGDKDKKQSKDIKIIGKILYVYRAIYQNNHATSTTNEINNK